MYIYIYIYRGRGKTWLATRTRVATGARARADEPACRRAHDKPMPSMPKAMMCACIQKRLCTCPDPISS